MRHFLSCFVSQKFSLWQSTAWLTIAGLFGLALILSVMAPHALYALIATLDVVGFCGALIVMLGVTVWTLSGKKDQ